MASDSAATGPEAGARRTWRSGLLFRNRDFRWFWAGQSVSLLGSYITAVALPLIAVLTLHAGAVGVSLVTTASYLPNVLLPLLAGEWLERRRRRRIMVICDLVRAVALAAVPVAYLMDSLTIALLTVVAFIVGAASVVFDIAGFAYIPTLVGAGDLPAAVRSQQASSTVANFGGPGAAGLLAQLFGPVMAIIVDAVSYLASVFGVTAARTPEPAPPVPEQRVKISSGLTMVLRHPFLRALALHAAGYNLAYPIITVNLVVYAIDDRGLSAGAYGLILTLGGCGGFVGAMIAIRLAQRFGYGQGFAMALVLTSGLPLLFAPAPFHGVAFLLFLGACMLLTGTGGGVTNVLSITLRQVGAPPGFLARTNGGYRLIVYGVLPVGSAIGGVLGNWVGPRAGLGIGAAVLALAAIPMLTRRVRSIKEPTAMRADRAFATADEPDLRTDAPVAGPS